MSELTDSQIIIAIKDSEKHIVDKFESLLERVRTNEVNIEATKEVLARIDRYHCEKEQEIIESIKTILSTNRWYKDVYIRVAAVAIALSALAVSTTMLIIKIYEALK